MTPHLIYTFVCMLLVTLPSSSADYVEYHPGTIPIILTSPHGGWITPDIIEDRMPGCPTADGNCVFEKDESCADEDLCGIVTVTDSYTINITNIIADTIEELLGEGNRPYKVISNLKRTKLDPNRPIDEAAQNDPYAMAAWTAFHGYIELSKEVTGRGILFDVHKQGNRDCTELGYLLSKSDLNNGEYDVAKMSIRLLAEEMGMNGEEIIIGPESFGAFLDKHEVGSVPSPSQVTPGDGGYFTGGYITQTHGSRSGGITDAIQLETPVTEVVPPVEMAKGFGRAIVDFYKLYYEH